MWFQISIKASNVFPKTAGLARYLLYESNQAAATSALRFPYECCTNCISEHKIGPSPGIFLGLFHCCVVLVQVLSSGIMANSSST